MRVLSFDCRFVPALFLLMLILMAMSMLALVMMITVKLTTMATSNATSLIPVVEENRLSNSSLPDFPNTVFIKGLIEKIGNKNIPCIAIY